MPKTAERKFGTIPEWAKTGPIDLRNYNFRAEGHCAQRSSERGGLHPTIALDSQDFRLWQEYFERYLGGRPIAFRALLDASIKEMTVPEQVPQWFDTSFAPERAWRST